MKCLLQAFKQEDFAASHGSSAPSDSNSNSMEANENGASDSKCGQRVRVG